ncbi:acyltransferase family protein [Acuticoccus sp.]|uniref:acyltransferase family protein n=1 Tax=Acuticoccus sp. TaxID=1904378 RepID=UPI003B525265
MHYRAEIDGLRALAVGGVVAHHAGAPLPGGFLGVDVFFVISGFLIAQIILADLARGRFDLASFWVRRVRRIVPALVVVVLACLPFAWVLMSPEALVDFAQSIAALAVFGTNVLFAVQSGYFAPRADEIALLHTWSLAVEEQFYLLFPVVALVLWRLGGRAMTVGALVVGGVLSLALAEVMAHRLPDAAFYLLPTRAWELLAGALAGAFIMRSASRERWAGRARFVADALSLAGLGLIIAGMGLIDGRARVPGVVALVPVVGTVLVLLTAVPGTLVQRLLSAPALVGVGLVSYSVYLWHQPVFAFARIAHFSEPPPATMVALTVVVLALSVATWRFVERPFRDRARVGTRGVFVGAGVAAVGLAAVGLVTAAHGGFGAARFGHELWAILKTAEASRRSNPCHYPPSSERFSLARCRHGADVAPTVAVFGDSHAIELAHALAVELERDGRSLVQLTSAGCPPALTFDPGVPGCREWSRSATLWLEEARGIDTVVLSWRHTAYLFGFVPDGRLTLPDDTFRIEGPGGNEARRARYWNSFAAMVTRLDAAGLRVIVAEPVPEIVVPFQKYAMLRPVEGGRVATVPRAYHEARQSFVLSRLTHLGTEVLPVTERMCDEAGEGAMCYGAIDGAALYFDDNHLSAAGARQIVAGMFDPAVARVASRDRTSAAMPSD